MRILLLDEHPEGRAPLQRRLSRLGFDVDALPAIPRHLTPRQIHPVVMVVIRRADPVAVEVVRTVRATQGAGPWILAIVRGEDLATFDAALRAGADDVLPLANVESEQLSARLALARHRMEHRTSALRRRRVRRISRI